MSIKELKRECELIVANPFFAGTATLSIARALLAAITAAENRKGDARTGPRYYTAREVLKAMEDA